MTTSNFIFIFDTRRALALHAIKAEKYAYSDPESTAVQLRIFAEKFVDAIYLDLSIPLDSNLDLFSKMTLPDFINATEPCVVDKLHLLRTKGNKAAHGKGASVDDALFLVKETYFLSAWLFVAHDSGEIEQLLDYIKPTSSIDTNAQAHQLEQDLMQSSEALVAAKKELEALLVENNTLVEKLAQANESVEAPSFNSETSIERLLDKGRKLFNRIDFEMAETYRRRTMSDVFSEYSLTDGQTDLVESLNYFLNTSKSANSVFLLKGYAGTGKTFITKGLTEYLTAVGRQFTLLAPTGKAAKVVSDKTNQNAATIHREIYSYDSIKEFSVNGLEGSETFRCYAEIKPNTDTSETVYIIDESSMISDSYSDTEFFRFGSGHLLQDLLQFINIDHNDHNKKIIFIGDDAQLPPVNMRFSPALSSAYLLEKYQLACDSFELTEVVRQKADSGVMKNATALRQALSNDVFNQIYFDVSFDDISSLNNNDVLTKFLSVCNGKISNAKSAVIIAASNNEVSVYNKLVREHFFPEKYHIVAGDKIISVANHYDDNRIVTNGEFGVIRNVLSETEVVNVIIRKKIENSDTETLTVELRFRDVELGFRDVNGEVYFFKCKVLENLLYNSERAITSDESKAIYVDFKNRHKHLNAKAKREEFKATLKSDPYFNAFKIKFGYAITCHKAQGSEWQHVFLKCSTHMKTLSKEYFRWLYTGITRSSECLYVIDPPNKRLGSGMKKAGGADLSWMNSSPKSAIELQTNSPPENDTQFVNTVTKEILVQPANKFGIPDSQPELLQLLTLVLQCIEGAGIHLVDIQHHPYQEAYMFQQGEVFTVVRFSYKGNFKVGSVMIVGDSELDVVLKKLLDGIRGQILTSIMATSIAPVFEFSKPFLEQFHGRLVETLEPFCIQVVDLTSFDWSQRYTFNKQGEAAVVDIWYKKDQTISTYQGVPTLSGSKVLMSEVEQLLGEVL